MFSCALLLAALLFPLVQCMPRMDHRTERPLDGSNKRDNYVQFPLSSNPGSTETHSFALSSQGPPTTTSDVQPSGVSSSDDPRPVVVLPSGGLGLAPQNPQSIDSGNTKRPLMMGYYPDWVDPEHPPEAIDFRHFDRIQFAFAVCKKDFSLTWDSDDAPALLDRLVYAGHKGGTKIDLSVGGWTGSQ